MENRRLILLALLGVVLFFLYQAWQAEQAAPVAPAGHTLPEEAIPSGVEMPAGDVPTALNVASAAGNAEPGATEPVQNAGRVSVETDLYYAQIDLAGARLVQLVLKDYPVSKQESDRKFALLDDVPGRLFVLQSGLAGSKAPLVTHHDLFTAAQTDYRLADDQKALDVSLVHRNADGVLVTKTYRFERGSYQMELIQTVDNASAAAVTASPYLRLLRQDFSASGEPPFVSTFTGVGFYEQKEGGENYRFRKTKLGDLDEDGFDVAQTGGWIAMLQHYFLAAILPDAEQRGQFAAHPTRDGAFQAQYLGAAATVEPGSRHDFVTRLYLGPKLQDKIGDVARGLDLTLDYGILTPISEPLFWLLSKFHAITGNWGVAIILLTLLVKGMMFKLSEAQYRSMAKMKKFAPKIQDLKERYGDDRERMQKAMMELYKKEGFNPLAGCWPLLVQFPVFIALYWVLLESVELRQAPFALWLNDLTSPDPFYVLPVLFGISMFAQQRLSGQQITDPMQQKIMNLMPIFLTAFFAFFQSGLVLYWFVSNLVGIGQQWFITRRLEREDTAKAATRR